MPGTGATLRLDGLGSFQYNEIGGHGRSSNFASEITQPIGKHVIAVFKEMERRLTVHEAEVVTWLIVQGLAALLESGMKRCGQFACPSCADGNFENMFARDDVQDPLEVGFNVQCSSS